MLDKKAKQRLVKYLEKKTPDAIAQVVKEKNLGPVLVKIKLLYIFYTQKHTVCIHRFLD